MNGVGKRSGLDLAQVFGRGPTGAEIRFADEMAKRHGFHDAADAARRRGHTSARRVDEPLIYDALSPFYRRKRGYVPPYPWMAA